MTRLMVDMTEVVMLGLNSGIQRVVRRLFAELRQSEEHGYQVVAVVALANRWYRLDMAMSDTAVSGKLRSPFPARRGLRDKVLRIGNAVLAPLPVLHDAARKAYAWYYSDRMLRDMVASGALVPLVPETDDILLMADSFWGTGSSVAAAQRASRHGARVVPLIHDVIPLTHPHLVPAGHGRRFRQMTDRIVTIASQILTVTQFSRDEVLRHFPAAGGKRFDVLGLGSDFVAGGDDAALPRRADAFLSVGTIEERKGQDRVLAAFEQLWADGHQMTWTLVGRPGNPDDPVVRRLKASPEFGRRLVWLDNADDAELRRQYATANATILASEVEGFGLPVIEAMASGCAVIASDIPAFREVAGSGAMFFDRDRPDQLAALIRDASRNAGSLPRPDILPRRWSAVARDLIGMLQ